MKTTDSQVVHVKGVCADTGFRFERYSVFNVCVRGKTQTVSYVLYPGSGQFFISTDGLPYIWLIPDGKFWCAQNDKTREILGARTRSTAFDLAVKHWWTGF